MGIILRNNVGRISSNIVVVREKFEDEYLSFLQNIENNGSRLPVKTIQNYTNPLVKKLVSLGYTDLLNIPQYNIEYELVSILGQSFYVTGGGNGSRYDKDGKIITSLPNNMPRYTFNPETNVYEGVYVEKEDTNIFLYSEDFENNAWNKARTTVINEGVMSPDGQNNGHSFDIEANNSWLVQAGFDFPPDHYTISFYVKEDEISAARLQLHGDGAVEDLVFLADENWKRFGLETFFDGTLIRARIRGTSIEFGKVLVWGASFTNSEFLTSYIKTENETVTRPADIYTANNLINISNPYTKFFIKNGDNIAEYYENGNKHTYINGVLNSTILESPNTDWIISSDRSDKYSCFALREGQNTENNLIEITS